MIFDARFQRAAPASRLGLGRLPVRRRREARGREALRREPADPARRDRRMGGGPRPPARAGARPPGGDQDGEQRHGPHGREPACGRGPGGAPRRPWPRAGGPRRLRRGGGAGRRGPRPGRSAAHGGPRRRARRPGGAPPGGNQTAGRLRAGRSLASLPRSRADHRSFRSPLDPRVEGPDGSFWAAEASARAGAQPLAAARRAPEGRRDGALPFRPWTTGALGSRSSRASGAASPASAACG